MFLGVDGGGSKTAFCVLTRHGEIAASFEGPNLYYFGGGEDGIGRVERVLREGISSVCREAEITERDITYAFLGLPGYGEASDDVQTLDALPRRVLGHDRYACDNDMVCGWAGSLGGLDGINVVSGTGSIVYGERRGEKARVGGWGELFGDEGSAYWVAIRGLEAFSYMSDGRSERGPLYGLLREHLSLKGDLDLVDVVLNQWSGDRSSIASLSPVVAKAADAGDDMAKGILEAAASELVGMIRTARAKLGFIKGERVVVSYSGGMFRAPTVLAGLRSGLAGHSEEYALREPLYSPVVGAALYAAKLAGDPLSEEALGRLTGLVGSLDKTEKEEV